MDSLVVAYGLKEVLTHFRRNLARSKEIKGHELRSIISPTLWMKVQYKEIRL